MRRSGILFASLLALVLPLFAIQAPRIAFADDVSGLEAFAEQEVLEDQASVFGESASDLEASDSSAEEGREAEEQESSSPEVFPEEEAPQPLTAIPSDNGEEDADAASHQGGVTDEPATTREDDPETEAVPLVLEPQATPQDLLNSDIWIKQSSSGWCTLDSAVMMLRRAAILNGSPSWRSITESSVKSVAWTNQGLRWSFTYQGISVACSSLRSSSEATLIKLLEEHPEGVVIYNYSHAVLLTDYTNGALYCADPAYGNRRKLSSAANNVRANNIVQYWYVTSHVDEPEDVPDSKEATVSYRTHVQNDGWQTWKADGAVAGTSGRSLRLEGINIKLGNMPYKGGIRYCTHVQNIGWQDWVADGETSGTSGRSLRLEAIRIELTGELVKHYDVYYRVHAQNFGWMGWAKNGQQAGTATYSYRLEAIQVLLIKKGSAAPGKTFGGVTQAVGAAFSQQVVQYRTHVQNDGWQNWVGDGAMAGTSGRSLRLEGIEIKLASPQYAGSIRYRTHVQDYGWQGWKSDGAMSGTSGESKRLEAIQIELTGEMAKHFDVWYRVHCQNIGWMGWAKNGAQSGTAGYSYRLEGIEIRLVEKGGAAPGSTANAFRQNA